MPVPRNAEFLADYKRRAQAALPDRVVKVVLYGSRARGDAEEESDWDVAVFFKNEPRPEERRVLSGIAFDICMETGGAFIQTVALPTTGEDEDTVFMRNMRVEGVEI